MSQLDREAVAPGTIVAGAWVIERPLAEIGGLPAVLARGVESGRAILFPLPADAADPLLDPDEAARWGTVRRVHRDERLGRVVVDEIPEGPLLAERLALGIKPTLGLVDDLARRVREAQRSGHVHGQLAPDRIVIGPEGPAIAGWGLGAEDAEQRKGRDLAWLSRLGGLAAPVVQPAPAATGPVEPGPEPAATPAAAPSAPGLPAPPVHRLQAAIVSSHRPTLKQALAEWDEQGGPPDEPTVLRARDALARLEKKIDTSLAEARQRLADGDPLGAVAPCREAIRLGAEAEAEPLLRQARRQARQLVSRSSMPSPRVLAIAGGAGVAVILLVVAIVLALRPDPRAAQLRDEMQRVAARDGERGAVMYLLARRDRGDEPPGLDALLADRLPRLAESERERMARLHRESVAQGARPREADRLADEALGRVAEIARGIDRPALRERLQRALLDVDQAAMLYRGATSMGTAEAARAVERLLLQDAVLAPGSEDR